jgi:hypothetical protein
VWQATPQATRATQKKIDHACTAITRQAKARRLKFDETLMTGRRGLAMMGPTRLQL